MNNHYSASIPRSEIYRDDFRFPSNIKAHINACQKLYLIGDVDLHMPMIAVIGAREASPYGLKVANLVSRWAVEAGFIVVSGCARGCDQEAHRSALNAGGKTIAVLGCGADVIYPSSAHRLLAEIAESGGILSRYDWGTPPAKYRFVERNQIIAALSQLVVVTEAKLPSGTFSTVEHALAIGINVAAVPGSIFSALNRGPNRLISDGALCISSEEDFKSALGLIRESTVLPDENVSHNPIIRALKGDAYHLDELKEYLKMPIELLTAELLKLEIEGLVTRYRDGRFAILKK